MARGRGKKASTTRSAKAQRSKTKKPASAAKPCECNDEFDAQAAYRQLARSLSTVVDAAATTIALLSSQREALPRSPQPLAAPPHEVPTSARSTLDRLFRIVGGEPTGDFPDCCCIGDGATWFCSGVLIRPNVVLTAGHCGIRIANVFVGGTDLSDPGAAEILSVAQVERHPRYDENTQDNDITLLILDDAATTQSVELATSAELVAATQCTLVGFGYNDPSLAVGFGVKRRVTVPITQLEKSPSDDLSSAAQTLGFRPSSEFVAGRKMLGMDTCNGDSGGPAYIVAGGAFKVAGLTSRATKDAAKRCGDGGIYVRPDFHLETFIRPTLAKYSIPI